MGVLNYARYLPLLLGTAGGPTPTAEYLLAEPQASDNAVDSIGGYTLTQQNSPGVVAGGRTFSAMASQQFKRVADATLGCLDRNFSLSANFANVNTGGTLQIVTCRNDGSLDGNLLYILRIEGTNLVVYVGNGTGTFQTTTLGVVPDSAYHAIFTFDATTGAVRGRLNGGSIVTGTGTKPVTLPASPAVGLGGLGAEYFNGTIYRVRLWSGIKLTDGEMLDDFNDTTGV